jgi:hypothetical protein
LKLQQKAGFPTAVVGVENAGLAEILQNEQVRSLTLDEIEVHEFFAGGLTSF